MFNRFNWFMGTKCRGILGTGFCMFFKYVNILMIMVGMLLEYMSVGIEGMLMSVSKFNLDLTVCIVWFFLVFYMLLSYM